MSVEIKAIDPCALASLTTGTVLCESFGVIHEAAEWLLGHPVWTHELIYGPMKDRLIEAALAVLPDLPTVHPDDWQQMRADLHARHGSSVAVSRGSDVRTSTLMATLKEVLS